MQTRLKVMLLKELDRRFLQGTMDCPAGAISLLSGQTRHGAIYCTKKRRNDGVRPPHGKKLQRPNGAWGFIVTMRQEVNKVRSLGVSP